ncbi:MAG: SDR family NAD(P)-dependent oxidoreductase [Candidatus Omnitrophica bacterium]|nr:SDR family NAD(P)-dependent oxidoreductase [Candidatus Omnitrophota bacterium]
MEHPKTAFITGASSGIGASFARKLAEKGYDLALTARRHDKLESLAKTIKEKHNVKIELIKADLSLADDVERLSKYIKERADISFLVNNAGFGTAGFFNTVDIGKSLSMINVHAYAATALTHAALGNMIKNNSGAIINVSSMAGFIISPGSSVYHATKSYLNVFSACLAGEMQKIGADIKIQALCPGMTETEFFDTDEYRNKFDRTKVPRLMWMTADEVVGISLKALESGKGCRDTGHREQNIPRRNK